MRLFSREIIDFANSAFLGSCIAFASLVMSVIIAMILYAQSERTRKSNLTSITQWKLDLIALKRLIKDAYVQGKHGKPLDALEIELLTNKVSQFFENTRRVTYFEKRLRKVIDKTIEKFEKGVPYENFWQVTIEFLDELLSVADGEI